MDLKKVVECPVCKKENTIKVLSGGTECWNCGKYISGVDTDSLSGDEKIELIARQFKQDVIKQLNTYDDDRWPPIDLEVDYFACKIDYGETTEKLEDSLRSWLLEEGFFTGIKLSVYRDKLRCKCNLTKKGEKFGTEQREQ